MGFDNRDTAKPYILQAGDTLQAIAERETAAGNPLTWQDIARYNWGTDDVAEVNAFLRDELGARHRDAGNNFVLASDDAPQGQLLIPVPFARRGLALEQTYTLRVRKKVAPPQFLECCHLSGVTFAFNRSFIRPNVVGYLKKLEAVANRHPEARIMIFGHTDAVDDDLYNKKLSERRAWSVYAFITNDPDAWEVLYGGEGWGLAVLQEILADLGHDPGAPDGDWGPQTRSAMRSFLGLPDEAPVQNDAAFRKQLFAAYMASKHDVGLPPDRFMEPGYMGCSEFNPVTEAEGEAAQNRRVSFFFFHPDRLPNLPCAFADVAPCKKQIAASGPRFKETFRCSFYDSLARDCTGRTDPVTPFKVVDFKMPPFLASGAETIQMAYRVVDEGLQLKALRLELYRRKPGTTANEATPVWTKTLAPHERTPGAHTLAWDGKIAPHEDFPDDYVTVEHSPYTMKLVAAGDGAKETVLEAVFKVEVAKIELELGDREMFNDAYKAIHDQLGSLPAPGEKKEIRLVSNLFFNSKNSDAKGGYRAYYDHNHHGPLIPLIARALVTDSHGQAVLAPLALGRVPFLWDWEDVSEDTSGHHPAVKRFLENALDYDRTRTQPRGDNCHEDRGGNRGQPPPATASGLPRQEFFPVWPDLVKDAFAFERERCPTRTWAAFTYPHTSGERAGTTGVEIRLSRMAGDAYKVSVYLAHEKNADGSRVLDVTDDAPLAGTIKAETGIMEIWREVHLARFLKKKASVPAVSFEEVQDHFKKAYMHLENKAGSPTIMTDADYYDKIKQAVEDMKGKGTIIPLAVDPDQSEGKTAIRFRSYLAFKKVAREAYKDFQGSSLGFRRWLRNHNVNTAVKYNKKAEKWANKILREAFAEPDYDTEGVHVFQFKHAHNLVVKPGGTSSVGGFALGPQSDKPHEDRCAIFIFGWTKPEGTFAHEIGHQLFLEHAPFPKDRLPPGADPAVHDEDWPYCVMSYQRDQSQEFCGFCQLMLRGWDPERLSSKATDNRKP